MAAALCIVSFSAQAKQYEIADYDIELLLTGEGNYLITERITFNFLSGTFTRADRHVPGTGFRALRFLGIDGIDVPVESISFRDGRSLLLEWTYPATDHSATFEIRYEAIGALKRTDGRNVIDWNPVGSEWDVPIRDIDVVIHLPEEVTDPDIQPLADLAAPPESGVLHFHRDYLPPRTHYHVVVSFPEIIPVVQEPKPPYVHWTLLGLLAGIVLSWLDVRRSLLRRPQPAQNGPDPASLSPVEVACLLAQDSHTQRYGVAATIFALARAGKLLLVVEPKRLRADRVRVEILSDEGLRSAERVLVDGLRKYQTLQRFATATGTVQRILRQAKLDLTERGLLSAERRSAQQQAYTSAIIPFGLAIASWVYLGKTGNPVWLGVGVLLFVHSVGRLISAASQSVLTPEGAYTAAKAKDKLQRIFDEFEGLVQANPKAGLAFLFDNLPWLMLHKRFTNTRLHRLKRRLRHVDTVEAPPWIRLEKGGAVQALSALTAIESLNYIFFVIMAAGASTGASTYSGAGAPGSGAGGGGGGAG